MNHKLHKKLKAPITLISHGRSGTSLLQNIFDAHPNISVAGETADLIFSTWYSIKKAEGLVPGLFENGKVVRWPERTARGVRAVFGEIFDFPTEYWMQKPIGQPFVMGYLRKQTMSLDEWFELYWNILNDIFPQGKFITILRHPCDVVLSSGEYWGRDQKGTWGGIATMAQCILHKSSKISYAVNYHELVEKPEEVIKDLFAHLEVPYDPTVLKALDYVYVPNQEGWKQDKTEFQAKIEKKFSRREDWDKLDLSGLDNEIKIIQELWQKYGYSLELPN